MSSITAADLKLGGRLVAACDAIGAGHLRRAAGIFNEVADDLNTEAESATGLLADEGDLLVLDTPVTTSEPAAPQLTVSQAPADMQSCARNVHSFGPTDPVSGWRTCLACGVVNVAPPEGAGPIDMSARQ